MEKTMLRTVLDDGDIVITSREPGQWMYPEIVLNPTRAKRLANRILKLCAQHDHERKARRNRP
jgi:hypothetical protein